MDRKGFTLLELVISLTILSVIVTIIFGALHTGVRAWEKGEKHVQSQQQYRTVLNIMERQMSAIDQSKLQSLENRPFYLKGDEKRLEFLSRVSLVPANEFGLVYVQYRVFSENGKNYLKFYEKNILLMSEDVKLDEIAEEDFYELMEDMAEFRFDYLSVLPNKNDLIQELDWQPLWNLEGDKKAFPLAVRLKFQAEKNSDPVYMIIPIKKDEKAS